MSRTKMSLDERLLFKGRKFHFFSSSLLTPRGKYP